MSEIFKDFSVTTPALEIVRSILVDRYCVEEYDDVPPSMTLMGDLDLESIEVLDILFQVDKALAHIDPRLTSSVLNQVSPRRVLETSHRFRTHSQSLQDIQDSLIFSPTAVAKVSDELSSLEESLDSVMTVQFLCDYIDYWKGRLNSMPMAN